MKAVLLGGRAAEQIVFGEVPPAPATTSQKVRQHRLLHRDALRHATPGSATPVAYDAEKEQLSRPERQPALGRNCTWGQPPGDRLRGCARSSPGPSSAAWPSSPNARPSSKTPPATRWPARPRRSRPQGDPRTGDGGITGALPLRARHAPLFAACLPACRQRPCAGGFPDSHAKLAGLQTGIFVSFRRCRPVHPLQRWSSAAGRPGRRHLALERAYAVHRSQPAAPLAVSLAGHLETAPGPDGGSVEMLVVDRIDRALPGQDCPNTADLPTRAGPLSLSGSSVTLPDGSRARPRSSSTPSGAGSPAPPAATG